MRYNHVAYRQAAMSVWIFRRCDFLRPQRYGERRSYLLSVAMARAASFDRDLEYRVGEVIGKEIRANKGNYFGGVCINLLRHPAGGRAQDAYGEDSYLLGLMAAH
jgi:beta-glucosidase-like glycosyl hydrolase